MTGNRHAISKNTGKPLIGVMSKPVPKEAEFDSLWQMMHTIDDIRFRLIESGALVVGLLPTDKTLEFNMDDAEDSTQLSTTELENLHHILTRVDGLVLQGGLSSAQYEVEAAKYCLEKQIPILGICAGFNNLVRAAGGKIFQDQTGWHNQYQKEPVHNVTLNENSLLYRIIGKTELLVNSIHSWITDEQNIGRLVVAAKHLADNTVEAVESPTGFALGVKWHPEIMDNESASRIFRAFVEACYN